MKQIVVDFKEANSLWESVERLRRNRQALRIETLEKKYPKAMSKMKDDLQRQSPDVFAGLVANGLFMDTDDYETWNAALKGTLAKVQAEGIQDMLWDALYSYCDPELYALYAMQVQCRFEEDFYMGYWLSHTGIYGGKYYNSLCDMFWQEEGFWYRDDGHMRSFNAYRPPEKESYENDLAKRREDIKSQIAARTGVDKMVFPVVETAGMATA